VKGSQAGLHHSVFRGHGIEFNEIREYVPGDDVQSIDWEVPARYNRPFVEEYNEEQDQTFNFVLDISGSAGFGSEVSKKRKNLEVAAGLAFAAIRNNDRICHLSHPVTWKSSSQQRVAENTLFCS